MSAGQVLGDGAQDVADSVERSPAVLTCGGGADTHSGDVRALRSPRSRLQRGFVGRANGPPVVNCTDPLVP